MRYLPVFLDLQTGPVLLVGAGDLARAKLRLLAAAGARIRWSRPMAIMIERVGGCRRGADRACRSDPLAADLRGVIAILCAGAGQIGIAMSARAKAVGLPVNVMDDLAHSTFIFPAIVDRGDVVVAVGTGGLRPWWRAACASASKRSAGADRRSRRLHRPLAQTIHGRIPEFALRRRFWERVVDGRIGALVLAGAATKPKRR